jgi:hypothetical protein
VTARRTERATVPWSGATKTGAVQPTTTGGPRSFDRLRELHSRRTDGQLEQLLAERLETLRANPPKGYPR